MAPFDPAVGPDLLALFQEGEHEFVLGGEVVVERRLGDAGGDQLVDTDIVNAAMGKELVGGAEDAFASTLPRLRTGAGVVAIYQKVSNCTERSVL